MRKALPVVLVALGLGLAACSDGGSVSASASGSGSGSGSGSHADAAGVPAGVAAEYQQMAEEIAAHGSEKTVGDWKIGYIVEAAEPWFEASGAFRPVAAGENFHIEILPFEAASGRLVPNTPIKLEILDAAGKVVAAKHLPFIYGEFFHYANNFAIPTAGTYTLRATIGSPGFIRHGEQNEKPALSDGATVTFENVELKPSA